MHLLGFFPKGQTVENWTEMITVLGQKSSAFTIEQYFNLMIQKEMKSCSKESISAEVTKKTHEMLTGIIYCGKILVESKKSALFEKGQGKITAYKIHKKDDYLFPMVRIWRGKEFNISDSNDENFQATKLTIANHFDALIIAKICDKDNPQGAL